MTKVAIFGNAGGGKSTLCEALSRSKNLPVYQLDKLQWNPGWVPTPKEEFEIKHKEPLKKEKWIIDGVATLESIERRLNEADTIIFVDLPLWRHYWWAAKRQFMCIFRPRPNFIPGCPMLPKTFELIRMIWHINSNFRPIWLEWLGELQKTKQVFRIQSIKDFNEFYSKHCAL